ncbi:hypothetical protein [Solwaraspora sp. WMMD792]|uniref:hypothetical protein n=1 Tax=Solwaraspora sp. WMMD792 TaxID=3016099 RepID=UPI0024162290|nr:hypothetical protein [Solwaraspora sp. WMMD792]MDG4772547.1 hypothetical protein [Solwaraspora sp. WMMD792]
MADFERRRRRHRHGAPTERPDSGPASASTAEVHDPEQDSTPEPDSTPITPEPDGRPVPGPGPRPQSLGPRAPEPSQRVPEPPPTHRQRRQTSGRSGGGGSGGDDREADRGLRGLVGSGTSQVSTSAALRARDASRPSEDDLARAEETLTIVRRHWVPREELPRRER